MNKKKLSVVMAGAMLASSVAPVLAADSNTSKYKEYEVNGSNRGILVRELRKLLTENVFANVDKNFTPSADYRNQSVYQVEVGGKAYFTADSTSIKAMEDAINAAKNGDTIKVFDRGHVTEDGKNYAFTLKETTVEAKFTKDELKGIADLYTTNKTEFHNRFKSMISAEFEGDTLTVVTRKAPDDLTLSTMTFKVGDKRLDLSKPLAGKDLITAPIDGDWSGLTGYEEYPEKTIPEKTDIDSTLLATITISDADSKETVALSDLYDGLLLTDKGNELLATLKEYKTTVTSSSIPAKYKAGNKDLKIGNVSAIINDSKNGLFTFDINLYTYSAKKDGTRDQVIEKKVITVSSNNKSKLEFFQEWMINRKPLVDVLAGDNRYETAVEVAKENADITTVATNGNIVLVNGNSLIDGLAAAPLAAAVWNKDVDEYGNDDYSKVAPILLTESDSLPKATKAYIKELIAEQKVGNLDKVTVYLVGGETVISKSLENELKEYGLRVVRAGGANREETSLKVAEVMLKDGAEETLTIDVKNPFIVGAEGEADAMSIAPVAAGAGLKDQSVGKRIRPIIVESKNGLSEKALGTMEDWKNDKYDSKAITATIVGGKNVVSKETEDLLVSNDIKVDRVSGSNRQATNAAVIDRYYKDSSVKKLVVSKDGQNKKSELIDALTATSLAVKDNAPIVLGTNKLSNAQINTLEQKATRTGVYVYQVGHGVARDVLKTIADRVGLAR